MKKTVTFVVIILACTLFLGCPLNPKTMVPKSSAQICSSMKETFGGTFEVIRNENTTNETQRLNKVYMTCSQLPGKTIVTTHGYEESIFGWHETFTTNYNRLYYQNDIETTYGAMIDDWFGDFEYKAVFANADTAERVEKYSSFQNYLEDSITYIVYKIVINASVPSTKNVAQIKTRSAFYDIRNEVQLPIWVDLYLWEDADSYQALDDDEIADFSSYHEYAFTDMFLENYSE